MIIAIDPGTTESAMVAWDGSVICKNMFANDVLRAGILNDVMWKSGESSLYIEMVACYGMPVGKETFETCVWIGRFWEAWRIASGLNANLMYRSEVKMHLCQSMRAKDANIRQALIDRFGPPGTKANQGKLYGVKSHLWSALAIAVTAHDTQQIKKPQG